MSRKKDRGGIVYSTNPDFSFEEDAHTEENDYDGQQNLIVGKSTKGRGGKTVTVVSGFKGNLNDLDTLAKVLKNKCGTGGSVKDNEILIQGDVRIKVAEILRKEGYKVKVSGL